MSINFTGICAKLTGVVPNNVLAQIPDLASKFNIDSIIRLAHFLAQCAHESDNFVFTSENLNYSSSGLIKTFPAYFDEKLALLYAHKKEMIGNRVYASRMGNGDADSGDGYKFRGRGYIQITGKSNYSNFGKFIGYDAVSMPDLVATKYPLLSAAFFFKSSNILKICDLGATDGVIKKVTRAVNGGENGLSGRITHFHSILTAIDHRY